MNKIQAYEISDITEETFCVWCGMPLYVGDKVYYNDLGSYCSEECSFLHAKMERGSALPEIIVSLAIITLVCYMAMSWAMGTTNVSLWAGIMESSASPIIKVIWDILYLLGIVNKTLA